MGGTGTLSLLQNLFLQTVWPPPCMTGRSLQEACRPNAGPQASTSPSLALRLGCGLAHLEPKWGLAALLLGWLIPKRWLECGGPWPAATTEPQLPPGQTRDRTDGSASEHKRPLSFPSYYTHSQHVGDHRGMPHVWVRCEPRPRAWRETVEVSVGLRRPAGVPVRFAETHEVFPLRPAGPVCHPWSWAWWGPSLATWGAPCQPSWNSAPSLRGLGGVTGWLSKSLFGRVGAGHPTETFPAAVSWPPQWPAIRCGLEADGPPPDVVRGH